MRAKIWRGFSLMEMMVVLLIVAIIAAASAPMVTKKLSRNAGTGDSPWVFTGLNNNIAYNMSGNDNATVIIGSSQTPANMQGTTRLYIDSGNNASHIAFGNGNSTPLLLTADPTRGRIGFSNQNIPDSSVAFGTRQSITDDSNIVAIGTGAEIQDAWATALGANSKAYGPGSIAIGCSSRAQSKQSIAIGGSETNLTDALGENTIAIGSEAATNDDHAVAIGSLSRATLRSVAIGTGAEALSDSGFSVAIGEHATASGSEGNAIGRSATASGLSSIAIGRSATASNNYSVAIGNGASTSKANQIVIGSDTDRNNDDNRVTEIRLGGPNTVVYIPGHLAVGGNVGLGLNSTSTVFARLLAGGGRYYNYLEMTEGSGAQTVRQAGDNNGRTGQTVSLGSAFSDRRLKNVGEKYTAGLAELKKLDFFHYTFKKDENKTPHVGVMAQDLQKVFPDAVTKAEDGYLQIRFEDMFYAVINAVKELDNKIAEIVQNITDMRSTIDKQNKTIEEQQQMLEEQKQLIKNLEKRIEKLED